MLNYLYAFLCVYVARVCVCVCSNFAVHTHSHSTEASHSSHQQRGRVGRGAKILIGCVFCFHHLRPFDVQSARRSTRKNANKTELIWGESGAAVRLGPSGFNKVKKQKILKAGGHCLLHGQRVALLHVPVFIHPLVFLFFMLFFSRRRLSRVRSFVVQGS